MENNKNSNIIQTLLKRDFKHTLLRIFIVLIISEIFIKNLPDKYLLKSVGSLYIYVILETILYAFHHRKRKSSFEESFKSYVKCILIFILSIIGVKIVYPDTSAPSQNQEEDSRTEFEDSIVEEKPDDYVDFNDENSYVDLGLPSGTLWAKCNLGANQISGLGDYYAWGEIMPKQYYGEYHEWENYIDFYSDTTYKFTNNKNSTISKYNDNDRLTTLLPEDDAATVNLGTNWRMPTIKEFEELRQHTLRKYVEIKGVQGIELKGPNGNTIFFPANGYQRGNVVEFSGERCYYWSSTRSKIYHFYAYYIEMSKEETNIHSILRYDGYTIRPVRVKN